MSRLLSQKHTVEILSKGVNQSTVSSVLPQLAGVLLSRHMHMVFPVGTRGGMHSTIVSVSLCWVATVEKIKHASLRHTYSIQLFRIRMCNLKIGSSINFTLTFHSCKNCRLPCVHSLFPWVNSSEKNPFSLFLESNPQQNALSITRVQYGQQGPT